MILTLGISALAAWAGMEKRRDSVQKPVVSAVHQKTEMRQKVRTDDG
jgi:hypothetical protein